MSPLISYRPPLIGFDDWFNTFRLGRGNFDRFKDRVGTVVTLYDKSREKVMGYARLTGVACGTMDQVLDRYAHSNHLCIGSKVAKEEAPEWLRAKLLKIYKTMFKTEDRSDLFSVLFMVRCAAPKGLTHGDTRHSNPEAA